MYEESIKGVFNYKHTDTFMGSTAAIHAQTSYPHVL